jgi:outer membrane protein
MRYIFNSLLFVIIFSTTASAQKKWSLLECVNYALANNIGIKQTSLQAKLSDLQLNQDKLGQYPTANINNNYGMSFGRRENPTTGIFEDQRFFNVGLNMQSSVSIFNWYSQKNRIAADKFEVKASNSLIDKQKNDLALSVASGYLQVLLNKKQEEIVGVQLEQSKQQLINTRKLVNAGSLPELNASELEAQVARDSANVITAKGSTQQNILSLKSLMNVDAAEPFDVEAPPVEKVFVEDIATLQPEAVYNLALANMPLQQFNNYKYLAAEKTKKSAKGAMMPSIGGFGSLSTNYIYFRTPIPERIATGIFNPTGLIVNNGTSTLNVLQPEFKLTGNNTGYFTPGSFFKQFGDNFGQNVGIGISVPLFNGGSLKTNYERSKINLQTLELTKQQDNQKLKQDIYQAYNAAIVALEKFNASKKSVETAERSFGFANRRYEIGMLTTLELITNQNNLLRAKLEYALNQFDYVFKMKVLEFYKGMGLKF